MKMLKEMQAKDAMVNNKLMGRKKMTQNDYEKKHDLECIKLEYSNHK
jgi:hypothetical protein